MSPDEWRALREHFEALCDLDPEAQRAALRQLAVSPEHAGQLQAMLIGDRADRMRDDALKQAPRLTANLGQDDLIGSMLGHYQVEALIGEGGMGRVYRARRVDGRYQGLVAIKFVAEGGSAEGFKREREALARLLHPGIARLLDAGENSAGRPYLVMELVEGESIDGHCARHALSDRARVGLIVEAARAIAYAHESLVLHRDLKPDNLLIDKQGQLKILDFGIAKLLVEGAQVSAQTTARFFTLRYAAPEQIFGGVLSTATDIYALAVVLFELLSGQHPYLPEGVDSALLAERLLSSEPARLRTALRPSTDLPRELAGARLRDLEAVLQRALTRGQTRYGSAKEFADDLQDVLDDRPVSVRSLGNSERVWRWLWRHRAAAAAMTIALAGVAIGLGLALWQAGIARSERDAALREARRAERMAAFLTDMFEAPRPAQTHGARIEVSDLLERGRQRLAEALHDDPLVRAQMQATIAETYRALGQYRESQSLLDAALATLAALPAPERAPIEARLYTQLGKLRSFEGRWREAHSSLGRAIALSREHRLDPVLASALRLRAIAQINLQQVDAADASVREELQVLRRQSKPDAEEIAAAELMLATVAISRNDLATALASLQQSIAVTRARFGNDRASLLTSLNNLAAVQMRLDQAAAAEENYRESARIAAVNFGAGHREQGLPLLGLAVALRVQGKIDASLQAMSAAQKVSDDWDGPEHPASAYAHLLHAELLWLIGRRDEASSILARADQVLLNEYGAQHVYSCRSALLRIALDQSAAVADSGPRMSALVACLDKADTPGGIRLLARWAAVRQAHAQHSTDAGQRASELIEQSRSLVPRDLALQDAIARWSSSR